MTPRRGYTYWVRRGREGEVNEEEERGSIVRETKGGKGSRKEIGDKLHTKRDVCNKKRRMVTPDPPTQSAATSRLFHFTYRGVAQPGRAAGGGVTDGQLVDTRAVCMFVCVM